VVPSRLPDPVPDPLWFPYSAFVFFVLLHHPQNPNSQNPAERERGEATATAAAAAGDEAFGVQFNSPVQPKFARGREEWELSVKSDTAATTAEISRSRTYGQSEEG